MTLTAAGGAHPPGFTGGGGEERGGRGGEGRIGVCVCVCVCEWGAIQQLTYTPSAEFRKFLKGREEHVYVLTSLKNSKEGGEADQSKGENIHLMLYLYL